jgi:chorismate dehydratase
LLILPEIAIASRRAVRSILLVSKVPIERVCTVALDTSSMTSVALTKILFGKWLGGGRTFTAMAPDIDQMLAEHDAGLLIGDPALKIDRSRYHTRDLAEEWIRRTGKPFVFAFWAVRADALSEADPSLDLASIFQTSRDHGLQPASLSQIAREWAPRLDISEADVRLPGGSAAFLPLRGRDWRIAFRARVAFRRNDQGRHDLSLHPMHGPNQ